MSLDSRVAFGAKILKPGAEMGTDWERNRERALESDELALKLCLIHPDWFEPEIKIGDDPRGRRAFSTIPPVGQVCQSNAVWGYDCSIDDGMLVADHLYPFSAGGPTESRNLVWLCKWHNSVKSSDIHLVDWEAVDCRWVDDLIIRVGRRRELLKLSRPD
jgi:hypothetical protein